MRPARCSTSMCGLAPTSRALFLLIDQPVQRAYRAEGTPPAPSQGGEETDVHTVVGLDTPLRGYSTSMCAGVSSQ